MTIVTISRGSYSMGKIVAEKAALRLGYECISREILLEASDKYNIPETKLVNAIIDTPSFLNRFTHDQENFISYIQSALTRRLSRDNIVYHGLAGHVFLKNVSHVLKVCIVASVETRVANLMAAENVSEQQATHWITKVDKERQKWTQQLYGVDPWDPLLYDIILKIDRFEVDDVVEHIYMSAKLPRFMATDDSNTAIEDLATACDIKAELVSQYPGIKVSNHNGNVIIYAKGGDHNLRKLQVRTDSLKTKIKGINNLEIHEGAESPPTAV
jgi:cytidylate kinase